MAQKQSNGKSEKVESEKVEAKDLRDEELSADVDDLLDEIDDVLESNAEEFVKGYVQMGGQ